MKSSKPKALVATTARRRGTQRHADVAGVDEAKEEVASAHHRGTQRQGKGA